MARFVRPLISVTLVALTVLGLVNVNEDPHRVEGLASEAVCSNCSPTLRGGSTNPFQMKFEYRTTTSDLVAVTCRKSLIFAGPYRCQKELSP